MIVNFYIKPYDKVINSQDQVFLERTFEKYEGIANEKFKKLIGTNEYIEGAIVIKYNNSKLFEIKKWDFLDQLLCYLIEGLFQIIIDKEDNFSFFYPDQPIELILVRNNNKILIKDSLGDELECPIAYLATSLSNEAIAFFEQVNSIRKIDDYEEHIDKGKQIITYFIDHN